MTERRLPGALIDADENDIIQRGAGGLWVSRSPEEVVLPNKVDGVTGGNYSPSAAISIDRFDARVRAAQQILLDNHQSLKISNQLVRFELSMFASGVSFVGGLPAWVRAVTGPNTFGAWVNAQTGSSANYIFFPLMLPPTATLVEVGVTIEGGYNGFNHTNEPSGRPSVDIREINRPTGVSTEIYSGIAAAIGQTAYDNVHTIVAAATPIGLNTSTNLLPYTSGSAVNRHFLITIGGEDGANALDSRLALHGIYADIQLTQVLGRL